MDTQLIPAELSTLLPTSLALESPGKSSRVHQPRTAPKESSTCLGLYGTLVSTGAASPLPSAFFVSIPLNQNKAFGVRLILSSRFPEFGSFPVVSLPLLSYLVRWLKGRTGSLEDAAALAITPLPQPLQQAAASWRKRRWPRGRGMTKR